MRQIKRGIHLDFHTLPGIYDFNREWDAAEFARILKDAKVEYVNAFAKCNIGFAYYPTKIGLPYPGMKGDMFGDLLRECHKQNIGVSAYFNVGLDHEHAIQHVDWLRIDGDGHVLSGDRLGNGFRCMCYNSPDYEAYILGMVEEVCKNYDVDGIFFDCMSSMACHCYHCVSKMKELGIDYTDEGANMEFQRATMLEFAKKAQKIIGDDKYLLLNGIHYAYAEGFNSHIEVECLPGAWGYDYFWSRMSYARTIYDNVLYMTGRFQKEWGDFGGFKGKVSLENDYYEALCAGVGISVGDHMNPGGNLEKGIYKTIGEINEWLCKIEPYIEGTKYVSDIGIVLNKECKLPTLYGRIDNGTYMSDSYPGLVRMLLELRHSFDVINETMNFSKYKLLIIPDDFNMNETMKNKLSDYLAKGGKVLSSGTAALNEERQGFVLDDWDFEFCGVDKRNSSYYKLIDTSDEKLCDMSYCMYSNNGILMKADNNIAKYVNSYFNFEWDGIHGYSYTPPNKETDHSAAAINSKGNVCHISFSVFKSYFDSASYAQKALVKQCIDMLLEKPIIKTEGIASTSRVTVTACDTHSIVHVKTSYPELRGRICVVEEHTVMEAGTSVFVRGEYENACTLPDKLPLESEIVGDGYTRIILPRVEGYVAVYLENIK